MTAPWPRIALVATPDVGATVLYEFNLNARIQVAHQGFELGRPEWSGEPGVQGGTAGYRTVAFTHWVDGGDAAAVTEMATLGQLLTADYQWLLIHLRSGAEPTWAKVWRSTPGALSWEDLRVDKTVQGRYGIPLSLTADPYLVGVSTALATAQTVNNDPASGTNPCRLVLGAVNGDAPAPLEVKVDPSVSLTGNFRWLLSLHAGDTQRVPVVWQIGTSDAFTAGTDTGAAVADATYSGGSYRPVTFATNTTLINRITGSVPAVLSSARYKVLCRVGFGSPAGNEFQLRFGQWGGSQYEYGDTKVISGSVSNRKFWVDLGDFTFPHGVHPEDAVKGNAIIPDIAVQAARPSGSGEMRLDCVMLVPIQFVDTRAASTLFSDFGIYSIGTGTATWDADTERFWMLTSGGDIRAGVIQLVGGFPRATPGVSNVLTVLQAVDSTGSGADDISGSTAVTVTYRPRWLWPRP